MVGVLISHQDCCRPHVPWTHWLSYWILLRNGRDRAQKEGVILFIIVIWSTWISRNKSCFRTIQISSPMLMSEFKDTVKKFLNAQRFLVNLNYRKRPLLRRLASEDPLSGVILDSVWDCYPIGWFMGSQGISRWNWCLRTLQQYWACMVSGVERKNRYPIPDPDLDPDPVRIRWVHTRT